MERDKRKKSKMPCLFGGNGENLNRKTVQPRSTSDGLADQTLKAFEVGQTSSKQVNGTPMKTLLTNEMLNEMLNETSAKKRSPSLIAKLMGLDGLPSPQPIHRQQKKLSENFHKSAAKRNEKPFNHQLDKKSTMEQQYFKDVYEDPEASHVGNQLYSPPLTAKRRSTKQELGYIQERCDEMLRESFAIKTKLERVDSNSDLMLGFSCNQITLLKPSNSVRHGVHEKRMKEEKETLKYRGPAFHHRHNDELLSYSCHISNNSRRSSRYQVERKDEIAISSTRIVVLKPNVPMFYNDQNYVHSPDEFKKNTELEFRSSRHKSREAKEIAKQITSQMKEGFENGHINLFDYGYRGYASASASESEMTAVSSRNSFDHRRSSSSMSESAVIREAKKRMSRRWKTHGYKDEGMIGKSSTLEEMLSVPNSEIRHGKTKSVVAPPVEVNDEYGWREGYQRSTSRSRSLPPPFSNRSHRTSHYHEPHADEKIMVHNEPLHRGKSKGVKSDFYHKEDSRSKSVKYNKRCPSSQHCKACSPVFDDILPTETYYENENPAEQKSLISDIHGATTNAVAESFNELIAGLPTWMLGDAYSSAVNENSLHSQEPSTANSHGAISIQLSGPQPESSEGSKEVEVDQHSQTSVLKVLSTEDVSSGSDCFERVSSQLHELRKQLHMLKMESGSTYESPNDEEIEQGSSFIVSESDNWESSYLTDLLQNSGFYDQDPHTFMTTWHSVDCPIDPWLFDHLEKKYSQDSTVSRSERRMFYDRGNEALCVIFKTVVSCSWVNPGQRGIQTTLTEIGLEDQLQKMLAKQEKEANEENKEISIDKDSDWFQPVEEIDVVGKQIAEVLLDKLILEFVSG